MLKKLLGLFQGQPKNTASPAQQTTFNPDLLNEQETEYCAKAGIRTDDAIFLKKLTQRPIEALANEYDTTLPPSGISGIVSGLVAKDLIYTHRDRFMANGNYFFISAISHLGYHLSLVHQTDPYEIMRSMQTNGVNHDVDTEDIIARYHKWDQEFGIRPIGIGPDFCECEIINRNIDYKALADEVYEFCPDVVDQGTETVELLEQELRNNGTIYLWWD